MTFLSQAAQRVFDCHGTHLEKVWVVLPTRRAVYFFKRELAACSPKPMLSPVVMAIDDFVADRCGVQIIDQVELLFELYEAFKEIDPSIAFEKFLNWATPLLKDFDAIDQYDVAAQSLFNYISEAKAIERWQMQLPTGRELKTTDATKQYFNLFDNIYLVYQNLQKRLTARKKAYRGMAYRYLAANAESFLLDKTDFEKIYFVGFNALSTSEERFIKTLLKAQRAELIWDTDAYYMDLNPRVEGGKLLRKYRQEGWAGPWNYTGRDLAEGHKKITLIGVPNASMQPKVAGDVYLNWLSAGGHNPVTAIVLADETMLLPTLYAIDEQVKDLNITMGLSLKNSVLFTLIDSLFELQRTIAEFKRKDGTAVKIPKFNHRTITKVLNHPFIRRYELLALQRPDPAEPTVIQKTLRHIQQNNLVYLDEKQLLELGEDQPLFQNIFCRWPDDPRQVIGRLYALIDLLRIVYAASKDAIETEYLYLFYTLLKQLETSLDAYTEKLSVRHLKQFLYELIRQTKIPFSGEPVSQLQVMGMLETRTLDFERVILVSMNEGILPSTKRQNSLVPFDAAREHNLPTYTDADAVMSYHFYRLLQRAKEVVMIYVSAKDAYNGGEKSRFLMQIEHELARINPNIDLQKKTVEFEDTNAAKSDTGQLTVQKSDETLAFIKHQLTERGLYPTHLNEMITCSLQYYFKRVAGIDERQEVEEEMGVGDLGTWVHRVLERLDQAYFMQNLKPAEAEIKAILKEEFEAVFNSYVADEGVNRLVYQGYEKQVLDFLKFQDEATKNTDFMVLSTEQKLSAVIEVAVNGETLLVKIAGKIDRIELQNNVIRVVDYKTGKVDSDISKKKAETLVDKLTTENDFDYDKIRQLWIYKYLIYKKLLAEDTMRLGNKELSLSAHDVTSGFYSLKNIKGGFIQNPVKFADNETPEHFVAETELRLQHFLVGLLDKNVPFEKTENLKVCEYCDYHRICGR